MNRDGEVMTFIGNAPYPARRNDWPRLAAMAAQLLAQREERYPALVDSGKLEQDVADRGIRIMRAIAEQWRRVVVGEDLPEPVDFTRVLGASWPEMCSELAEASRRARDLADRRADDRAATERADLTAALDWQQQPCDPGCFWPHIAQSYAYALWERARAAGRDAA